MRVVLQILGVAALLVGLLWIGQGLGIVAWPETSFMIDQRIWAVYGTILALIGVLLLWRTGRWRR